VHTDAVANEAASVLHAQAFTSQNHIWLGANQSPESVELMAHEATHVVQNTVNQVSSANVQRKVLEERVNDGEEVRKRMQQRIRDAVKQSENAKADQDIPAESSQDGRATTDSATQQATRSVDRVALAEKKRELQPDAVLPVDRQAEVRPTVAQATQEVKEKSEQPPEPIEQKNALQPAKKESTARRKTGEGEGVVGDAGAAAELVDAALTGPGTLGSPALSSTPLPPVPEVGAGATLSLDIAPIDAKGEPLPTNPEVDSQVAELAQQAQTLREQGQRIRARAAQEKGNAQILRSNIGLIQKNIGQAEQGTQTSLNHLAFRRDTLGKAQQALSVSEQKAAMVAKEAPTFAAKADEGKERSGPIARDATKLSAENKAKTPSDPEAAGNSQEQGEKLNKVGSDTAKVDDAISQTKERAETLVQDAAKATQMNTNSRGKIDSMQETLQQGDQRLSQMQQQNEQAHAEVEEVKGQPSEMHTQASALDKQGEMLIQAAADIELQLQQSQTKYVQDLQVVPGVPEEEADLSDQAEVLPAGAVEGENLPQSSTLPAAPALPESENVANVAQAEVAEPESAEDEGNPENQAEASPMAAQPPAEPLPEQEAQVPQQQAGEGSQTPSYKGDYEQRIHINVAEKLPSWLTGESQATTDEEKAKEQAEREQAQIERDQQRQDDLKLISDRANGNFNTLTKTDKALLAVELTGRKLFRSISKTQWPGWGLVKGLVDPRAPLMGVLSGFSMIVSAEANLFSKEQWQRDPLGNALKSAADIATGLTIIFGSITALALLIITLLSALTILLSIFTLGGIAVVTGPIIAFCATVVSTVGGWTVVTGLIALGLQALVLIKNLVEAATAKRAEELEAKSDDLKEDVSNAGNVLLQIGMAKLSQVGGKGLLAEIEKEGSGAAFARTLPSKFAQGAKALPGRIIKGVKALPGRVVGRAKAVVGGVARGARALGRGVKTVTGGAVRGVKAVGRGVKSIVKSLGREAEAEAETLATGEAAKLGSKAEQVADLERVTPETRAMLDKNPALRDALAENPRAADALKLCKSYCFPENATPAQIKRLNDLLEQAEKAGVKLDRSALKKFLYKKRANLDEAIGTLENRFSAKAKFPTPEGPEPPEALPEGPEPPKAQPEGTEPAKTASGTSEPVTEEPTSPPEPERPVQGEAGSEVPKGKGPPDWPKEVDYSTIDKAFDDPEALSKLTPEQRRIAADYYEGKTSPILESHTRRGNLELGRRQAAFNKARADYLRSGSKKPFSNNFPKWEQEVYGNRAGTGAAGSTTEGAPPAGDVDVDVKPEGSTGTSSTSEPPKASPLSPEPSKALPPSPRKPGEGINVKAKWGNPKSEPAYGHSLSEHGPQRPASQLVDRARGTGNPQGQWYNKDLIVEAEQRAPLSPGPHDIDMGRPVGRVYHPDGSVTEGVRTVRVVRRDNLTVGTSFPLGGNQ
jgi:hypothetical protein